MTTRKRKRKKFNPFRTPGAKTGPRHNTRGIPCTIVPDCRSGKPAFYVVGGKVACIEHRELAFQLAKKGVRTVALPEVGTFEPEIEVVEAEEVAMSEFMQASVDD